MVHVPETKVDGAQRRFAKVVNYGLAYGMEAYGLGQRLDIPTHEAAEILDAYFTGVPTVVDLAVMRDAMADLGGDPALVNPLVPADLVIDHSVQVDRFGTPGSFAFNVERECERTGERYQPLR